MEDCACIMIGDKARRLALIGVVVVLLVTLPCSMWNGRQRFATVLTTNSNVVVEVARYSNNSDDHNIAAIVKTTNTSLDLSSPSSSYPLFPPPPNYTVNHNQSNVAKAGDTSHNHAQNNTTETIRTSKESPLKSRGVVYAVARQDRAGSAIAHMFTVHAYAFQNNLTYKGACYRKSHNPAMVKAFEQHKPDHIRMLRGLGIAQEFPFACPSNNNTNRDVPILAMGNSKVLNRTSLWNEAWLEYMHSRIKHPAMTTTADNMNSNETFSNSKTINNIAVHVRRQDIKPCGRWADLYLPNAYYLRQLEKYHTSSNRHNTSDNNNKHRVVIYSTRHNPWEPFDDFYKHSQYTVALDTDLVATWQAMMTADVLIMSNSSFSLIPALLNRYGVVVAPPDYGVYLPHWHRGESVPWKANCTANRTRR